MFKKISRANFHFNHVEFNECSELVKDLIKRLLVVDPNKRLSSGEALNHEWFKVADDKKVGATAGRVTISPNVLMRLQNFKGVSKLK